MCPYEKYLETNFMILVYQIHMICKHILMVTLNEPKLILFYAFKCFQSLWCITNNSIKHQSFVYSQLNKQTVLFQTIQFCITHLLSLSLNVKQCFFCFLDRSLSGDIIPEWTWEWRKWRDTPHSPKLQHFWSLIIRFFNVINRTLVWASHPSVDMQSVYSTASSDWTCFSRNKGADIIHQLSNTRLRTLNE